METEKFIKELEHYLSFFKTNEPFEAKAKSGKRTYSKQADLLRQECEFALYAAEHTGQNAVIEAILDHCDENTLDELVQSYGEDSPIAQMIRRKRASAYQKVACELDVIGPSLERGLRDAKYGNPFYESVCKHLNRLGYKTDADFYNAISMPRQQFARIRDAANTLSKKTVLWIIVGLRLNYVQANDLLQKAGYHFRKNDMRDVVLTYILRNTTYDLDMVNHILDHFDLVPLC